MLAEVTDTSADTAEQSSQALLAELGAAHGRPVPLHGEEDGAWPVPGRLGLAPLPQSQLRSTGGTPTGLEGTLVLPDGERAVSNAQSVAAGPAHYGRSQRSS